MKNNIEEILEPFNKQYKEAKTMSEKYQIFREACFAIGHKNILTTYEEFCKSDD